jgi:predicted GNAT family acetyltransferase
MTAPRPHVRATDLEIHHDPASSCFECAVDGLRCVIDYRLIDNVMHIEHTEVPPALEGRGIAAALVRFALAHAREHGMKVHPLCSYVRVYMQRHADTQDLRA